VRSCSLSTRSDASLSWDSIEVLVWGSAIYSRPLLLSCCQVHAVVIGEDHAHANHFFGRGGGARGGHAAYAEGGPPGNQSLFILVEPLRSV
jgi:hypothetical protein